MDPQLTPTPKDYTRARVNAAANVIRTKLAKLYASEPAAAAELKESEAPGQLSRHQHYMRELAESGKSMAEIQTAWHNYYAQLTDQEKYQVWEEFYDRQKVAHIKTPKNDDAPAGNPAEATPAGQPFVLSPQFRPPADDLPPSKLRSVADVKKQLLSQVNTRSRARAVHHAKSLAFGLACGFAAVGIFMFSFYNERFIAPFITPSRNVSTTPIIIDPNQTVAVSAEPKIIIPKINVEVPVVYDETTGSEHAIQTALERGVVHYAGTALPGESGNNVIVGHSSNNLFNKGKYKFAFVLLSRLDIGDTFYLQNNGKRYVYRVFDKKIVSPKDVGVLVETPRANMASLITCDPPGTASKRLVVQGEQISPDPATNIAVKPAAAQVATPSIVPGNAESLFQRLKGWFF